MVGGGSTRHGGGGGDMEGAVVPVRWNRPMDGGTGMRLILRRLSTLGMVLLLTGGWRSDEREARQNGAQEPTGDKSELGERWARRERRGVSETYDGVPPPEKWQ